MEIHLLDIPMYMINIAVLYIIMRVLIYKPVVQFMSKREEDIEKRITDAGEKLSEAEERKVLYEKKLAEAETEAEKVLLDITNKATIQASQIINDAQEKAKDHIAASRARALAERADAVMEFSHQITEMAVNLSEEILRREVSREDNEKVIEAFFAKAR